MQKHQLEYVCAVIGRLQLQPRYYVNWGGCGAVALLLYDLFKKEMGLNASVMLENHMFDILFGGPKIIYKHVLVRVYDDEGEAFYIDGAGRKRYHVENGEILNKPGVFIRQMTAFEVRRLRSLQTNRAMWNNLFNRDNLTSIYEEIVFSLRSPDGLRDAHLTAQWTVAGRMGGRTRYESLLRRLRKYRRKL